MAVSVVLNISRFRVVSASGIRGGENFRRNPYDGVHHTPLGRFSKLVPIVSHTERYIFGKLSGRDDSNADRLGSDTIPTVEMSIVENRPRGV